MLTSHRRWLGAATAALGAVLTVSACQSVTPPAAAQASATTTSSGSSSSTQAAASLSISPSDGARDVRPDTPITVSATDGTLQQVTVRSGAGAQIAGSFNADHTSWKADGGLLPSTTYRVDATAVNASGAPTSQSAQLTTLKPRDSATYGIIPTTSSPVGVGMPVAIQFVTAVDPANRAAIERRVSVVSSPAMKGAWGWLDGRQLIWRPATYWTPGTKVRVTADIAGLPTSGGLWTDHADSSTFTIGPAMVSTVDTRTHRMTVTRNGQVLRVLKVSTGRPGSQTETRAGIKIILSRSAEYVMDSSTVGIPKGKPGYYNIKTQWAMRLTWSGEFLHSAPWSVGAQGNANVSHGCTNLAPADAQWLFNLSHMGDVVKFVGSTRTLEEYNGYTMWNETLSQWAAHSAL